MKLLFSKTELDNIFAKVESSELDLTKLEWNTIADSTDPKNTETITVTSEDSYLFLQ